MEDLELNATCDSTPEPTTLKVVTGTTDGV
jgi:hypothetical protein